MPRLPPMRTGTELKANNRVVPFSFFPTGRAAPRRPVQSLLFAIDPWLIMRRSVQTEIADQTSSAEALSYLEQAEDLFRSAASAQIGAAKPLQLYYCYLNLVKAFVMVRGQPSPFQNVQHGVSESLDASNVEFSGAQLTFYESPNARRQFQAFDEFVRSLSAQRVPNNHVSPLSTIIPQILPGHRLWASATDEKERFIALQRVGFYQNRRTRTAWLRAYLFADDVTRLGHTQANVLDLSGLSGSFRKVRCDEKIDGRTLICFEQRATQAYVRHAVDIADDLAATVKDLLWTTVASMPPYRRYYLYLCPVAERAHRLHQLGSIYSLTYYLGSITRYRPTVYREILDGPLGPRISEFVTGQAAQFVYLLASEFARQDVTKPSII